MRLNKIINTTNFFFIFSAIHLFIQIEIMTIIGARRAPYIPLKNKGGYGGKLITVKIPQMKRLHTQVSYYLLPTYQSTIFAKLK